MSKLELSEHGRFLFRRRDGSMSSGVVEELTETSALIRWDTSGNSVWYPLHDFKPFAYLTPSMEIVEKLKPRP